MRIVYQMRRSKAPETLNSGTAPAPGQQPDTHAAAGGSGQPPAVPLQPELPLG